MPVVERRDRLAENGRKRGVDADADERVGSRDQLVEQNAEREDVGAAIRRLTADLFRRHVGGRALARRSSVAAIAIVAVWSTASVCGRRVASPKSMTLMWPSSVSITFAGLRSR